MTEIYLIRHAQAEGNIYHMMQGHWDGDVTKRGLAEISALRERFTDIPVDAVYSSDLYRARLTASAISRPHHLPIHTDADLREINIGPWEGEFFGNVIRDEPESAHVFMFDSDKWVHDGAETYAQVGGRALAAIKRIAGRHPGQCIAFVSHGVTIRCVLSRILGLPLNDADKLPICGNTAVSHLFYDGESFTPDYINDTSHTCFGSGIPWKKQRDVRDVPLDPMLESEYYTACYADAWRSAHGSMKGFCAETYLRSAAEHHRANGRAVLRMLVDDESVGLLDMDVQRGAHMGVGWISLIYLKPEYRHMGLGVQVLGRAVMLYRSLGRNAIRLHVAERNIAARAFYEKLGFRLLQTEPGFDGDLLLMELRPEDREDV